LARKIRLGVIVGAGLVILGFWAIPHVHREHLALRACFDNVRGLREGALVRIAGVDVGKVTLVRARPDRKECPAEVELTLSTPYQLKVPSDATAELTDEGLLGGEYVEINVQHASAPPAADHAVLKTVPTLAPLDVVKGLADLAGQQAKPATPPANSSRKTK
jgi:ABC-type transporter Mla subunit MlaD